MVSVIGDTPRDDDEDDDNVKGRQWQKQLSNGLFDYLNPDSHSQ